MDYEAQGLDVNYEKAQFRFWRPENLPAVKGVMVLTPGYNGDGRGLVEQPLWQDFALRHSLALTGCFFTDRPHESAFAEHYAKADKGSGQALLDALAYFARQAKLPEVAAAPLALWGHSAGGQFNYEFACWKPERVLAFVVNKGGIYYTHLAPVSTRNVPGIFFIGENDRAFRKLSVLGIYAVNRRADALWTLVAEPKTGHDVGNSQALAIQFFEAVLPLRQALSPDGSPGALREDASRVGDLASLEIRERKIESDEWSAWLPSEAFAQIWQKQGCPLPMSGQ